MKKKIIKSLKISSLLGFVSNNIKADYTLTLIEALNCNANGRNSINLKGDNNKIIYKPTATANFNKINLPAGWNEEKKNEWKDVETNFTPVYYTIKENPYDLIPIDIFSIDNKNFLIDNPENVEEVIWIKKSNIKNIVTCNNNQLKNIIESKKFVIDYNYIYKVILNNTRIYSNLDDVKKHIDIKIKNNGGDTYNIEIIYYDCLQISDSVEFKFNTKDFVDLSKKYKDDIIKTLNNILDYVIIEGKDNNIFKPGFIKLKETVKKYTFKYNSKKYYIISDKEHKENELFKLLKTKNDLKDKDLIFDPNCKITSNLVPEGEYKIIDKPIQKTPVFTYQFTTDYENLFEMCDNKEHPFSTKITVFKCLNSNEESNFTIENNSRFINTHKYDFIAIKKGTGEKFSNDQILEPGTYKLVRKEKQKEEPKKDEKKDKDKGQGQLEGEGPVNPEKSKKCCNCC